MSTRRLPVVGSLVAAAIVIALAGCAQPSAPASPGVPVVEAKPTPVATPVAEPDRGPRLPFSCETVVDPEALREAVGSDTALALEPSRHSAQTRAVFAHEGLLTCIWDAGPDGFVLLDVLGDSPSMDYRNEPDVRLDPLPAHIRDTLGDSSVVTCTPYSEAGMWCSAKAWSEGYSFSLFLTVSDEAFTTEEAFARIEPLAASAAETIFTAKEPKPRWLADRDRLDQDCATLEPDGGLDALVGADLQGQLGDYAADGTDQMYLALFQSGELSCRWEMLAAPYSPTMSIIHVPQGGWAWDQVEDGDPVTVAGASDARVQCDPPVAALGGYGCLANVLVGEDWTALHLYASGSRDEVQSLALRIAEAVIASAPALRS